MPTYSFGSEDAFGHAALTLGLRQWTKNWFRLLQSGFTLIELLTAMAVLAVMLSIVMTSFMGNLRSNMETQIRYDAIQAAQSVLDEIRFQDISELTAETLPRSVTVGDRTFAVQVRYCENSSFCPSNEIRHISIDVSYGNEVVYETETIFSEL